MVAEPEKIAFQQTEVGEIPSDWEVSDVTQIIEKVNGIKIGPFGSQLKKESLTKFGYKVYGQENVYERDINLGSRYISREHFKKLSSCKIESGDFLVSMMGTIGKCMIVPNKFDTGIMDSHLIRLRLDSNKINSDLLLHFFLSNILTFQVKKLSVGGIMDGLSSKIIKSIILPLPPTLAEQTAIATTLTDADALITQLEKLIAKKKAIKQGAMQKLLKPKEGWKESLFAGIVLKNDGIKIGPFGSQLKKDLLVDQGYKVYGQENVFEKNMSAGERRISKEHFLKLKSCEIIAGDFLISMMGTIGKCLIVPESIEKGIMDSHLIRLRIDKSIININFLLQYFSSELIASQVKKLSVGGIMDGLSSKIIKSLAITMPSSINEQTHIAQILSDMDAEIEKLEQQLAKQKMLKHGMMQVLLTGKIRLVTP